MTETQFLGNCMYCDEPVCLGEQAEQHFSHATCDQQERESVESLESEKMQPCWGDFMRRIYELGITDPSEIAKVDNQTETTMTPAIHPNTESASTIEIQSPDGVTNITIPARWTVHDTSKLAETLEAAGYVHAKPRTPSAVLAFMPRPRVVPTGE